MKTFSKILGAIALCTSALVQAEPVMTLITVNTADPAGYAGWAKVMLKRYQKRTAPWQWGCAHQLQVHKRWVTITFGPSLVHKRCVER